MFRSVGLRAYGTGTAQVEQQLGDRSREPSQFSGCRVVLQRLEITHSVSTVHGVTPSWVHRDVVMSQVPYSNVVQV
jgi:hypothetical protein